MCRTVGAKLCSEYHTYTEAPGNLTQSILQIPSLSLTAFILRYLMLTLVFIATYGIHIFNRKWSFCRSRQSYQWSWLHWGTDTSSRQECLLNFSHRLSYCPRYLRPSLFSIWSLGPDSQIDEDFTRRENRNCCGLLPSSTEPACDNYPLHMNLMNSQRPRLPKQFLFSIYYGPNCQT